VLQNPVPDPQPEDGQPDGSGPAEAQQRERGGDDGQRRHDADRGDVPGLPSAGMPGVTRGAADDKEHQVNLS
jgi:hypothetical protein